MKKLISHLRKKDGERGISLIEILFAMGILLIVLVGVQSSVAAGLSHIKDYSIHRAATECARIGIEYMGTLPSDALYILNKADGNEGSPVMGSFAGGGFPAMNAFAASANGDCTKYSSDPSVNLAYLLCPGCVASTHVDAASGIENTTCQYTVIATVSFTGKSYKSVRSISYEKKMYGRTSLPCDDAAACGPAPTPPPGGWNEVVRECDLGL